MRTPPSPSTSTGNTRRHADDGIGLPPPRTFRGVLHLKQASVGSELRSGQIVVVEVVALAVGDVTMAATVAGATADGSNSSAQEY